MPSQPYWNELTSYVRTTLTSSFNKIDVVHLRIFLPDVLAAGNQCAWPNKSFACPSSDWIPSSSSNNRSSSNRVTITADLPNAPSTTSCARWCRNSSPSSSSNLSASWLPLRRSTACECHHFHYSPFSIPFFIFEWSYSIFTVCDFSLSFHGSYTVFPRYEVPPASLPPFKRLPSELISFAALNIFQSRPC